MSLDPFTTRMLKQAIIHSPSRWRREEEDRQMMMMQEQRRNESLFEPIKEPMFEPMKKPLFEPIEKPLFEPIVQKSDFNFSSSPVIGTKCIHGSIGYCAICNK